MSEKKEIKNAENFMGIMFKNWHIVLVVVSIIFSWAYFQFTLKTIEVRVAGLELKMKEIETINGDIKAINAKLDIIIRKIDL